MTIFGNILIWLVAALVLVISVYIALDITGGTRNKFLKWLSTGLITIIAFVVFGTAAICAFAICDRIAYDWGELRNPLYDSIVSKELHTIGCEGDFNMIISKDENGETILQTIIDNNGSLEVIDLNIHNFNFYLTDVEIPRIEYYSKVKVEPSSFRWIFNDTDTINIDLSNINSMYKQMKLKGNVYLPRTTNINQNLIIF